MSAATCPDFKRFGNTFGEVTLENVDSQNNN